MHFIKFKYGTNNHAPIIINVDEIISVEEMEKINGVHYLKISLKNGEIISVDGNIYVFESLMQKIQYKIDSY